MEAPSQIEIDKLIDFSDRCFLGYCFEENKVRIFEKRTSAVDGKIRRKISMHCLTCGATRIPRK